MRFGKNVLSQNLRTNCDLALYLTLFTDGQLRDRGLPAPLKARPGVRTLRDAGIEQETTVFTRLEQGLGPRCIGARPGHGATRWTDQPMDEQLARVADVPCVLVQPKFNLGEGRRAAFRRLGVAEEDLPVMPVLEGFVPDVAFIERARAGMNSLAGTGERMAVDEGDLRLAITLADVKHAAEANPSYEAEVALYGVMLANWLAERGLSDRFFVSAELFLWSRGGVAEATLQRALDEGVRDPEALVAAARAELKAINLPIYVQSIRRFFAERLPAIVRAGEAGWTTLDWHVGPACASCDWLGYEGWLGSDDRALAAAQPDHYCFSRASRCDHVSRVPLVTRGSRRVLETQGLRTVAQIAATTGSEAVYGEHSTLKSDRRSIPALAAAISRGETDTDPDRPDGTLARRADLDIFLSVNFDPGAGLLTGIGLQAGFQQPHPYGQRPAEPVRRRWRERWIVTAKSAAAERSVVLAFLQYLASVFEHVTSADPQRGGPYAADARAQIVFWDRRQFEELCLAMGRHLPSILYDRQDRLVRALAWIFPAEELQEVDRLDERRPAIAFVRDVVRRLVRVPAVHALTLFNVAEHYHYHDESPRLPDQFYREPLSDTIPRERIYEIWQLAAGGGLGTIRWGSVIKTLGQLTEGFARVIDAQGFALSSVTWRVRRDFGSRLKAEAPKIQLSVPNWAPRVAYDSKLWIAWAKFEAAFDKASRHLLFTADPEEAEASHEGLRLTRVTAIRPDGAFECEVSPESLNTKLRAPEGYLCLSIDAVPGFLALPAWAVIGYSNIPADLRDRANVRMHKIFPVSLEQFDRQHRTAVIRLKPTAAELARLRQVVTDHLGDASFKNLTLVPGLGSDALVSRLEDILSAVGNPPNALPARETAPALGAGNRRPRPGTDPVTPISRVLWEAAALNATLVRDVATADSIASRARGRAGLNDSQTAAVRAAAAQGLTVIWGPPGTGKTKTCSGFLQSTIIHEAGLERGGSYALLVTGPTYKAVGELVGRLAVALAADPAARCHLYSVYNPNREDRFPMPDIVGDHLKIAQAFSDRHDPGFRALVHDLASGSGVVVVAAVTHQCPRIAEQLDKLSGAGGRALWPLFDLVLIDESSQVDMTTGVGPLALLKERSQLIVAGDHLQMPPVVRCDPPLGAEHLVGSLQTYLTRRFGLTTSPLLENYRSHSDIVSYTRGLGYPPELVAAYRETRIALLRPADDHEFDLLGAGLALSPAWSAILDPDRPIVAVTYPDGMAGQANAFEAECVASLAWLLRNAGSCALDGQPDQPPHGPWDDNGFWTRGLGVVTPHRAQRAQVVQALIRAFPVTDPHLIEDAVDTVERFQGGERDTVIISFGVGDPDVIRGEERFLMQLERTNVAISRAKGKCVLLMSEEVANHIPEDRRAAATAHALRGVVDEWCRQRQGYDVLASGQRRKVTVRWR